MKIRSVMTLTVAVARLPTGSAKRVVMSAMQ
jgi:hypothetical protein